MLKRYFFLLLGMLLMGGQMAWAAESTGFEPTRFKDLHALVYRVGDEVGIKLFDDIHIGLLNKVGDDLGNLKQSIRVLNSTDDQLLIKALNDLPETQLSKLNNDFLSEDFIAVFRGKPELVDAWKALEDIGVDQVTRRNITHIENIDGYIKKYPNRTSTDIGTTANQFSNVEDYLNILPDITNNSLLRGTRFDDFVIVSELGNNFHHAEYSFHLWKSENWSELENFFNSNAINNWNGTIWPPNYGFKNISHTETGAALNNKVFDRFQGEIDLGGNFASPVSSGEGINHLVFTYDSRALGVTPKIGTYYIKFKLLDSPGNMNFNYGEAIPWFGTNGGGTQIKSSVNFGNLVEGVNYEVLEKMFYDGTNWIPQ